jgi:hypothetical protein
LLLLNRKSKDYLTAGEGQPQCAASIAIKDVFSHTPGEHAKIHVSTYADHPWLAGIGKTEIVLFWVLW